MTLFSDINRFGKYEIEIVCDNCGKNVLAKIKKGVTVADYAASQKIRCDNCGVIINFKEYRTKWLK